MGMSALRQANAAITQMLVGRGIQITQRGSDAYVIANSVTHKPQLINLPFLPDDAPDALVAATQGYIDHEAGHVLFTDWAVRSEAVREGLSTSHNIVEDVFVERSMETAFPGSWANLDRLHELFVGGITPALLREAGADEARALGALAVPAVRALAGQPRFVSFMDEGGHWHRPSLVAFLNAFGEVARAKLPSLQSSAECLEVARLLEAALRAGMQAATVPPATATEPRPDATGGSGAKPAGPGTGRGGGSERDGAAADEGGVASKAGRRRDSTSSGGGKAAARGTARRSGPGRSDAADRGTGPLAATDPFSSAVAKAISERAKETVGQAAYRVFTTDFDVIAPLAICGQYEDAWLADLDASVSQTVGALQKRLERAMAARAAVRTVVGCKSGRLHSGSLHKLALGDDRVFRRKQEAAAKDSAISLLIDNSGSMEGPKMKVAMMAGYALSQTAERLGLPCECLGFTTTHEIDPRLVTGLSPVRPSPSDGVEYSRTVALHIPIYKGFNERFGPLVRRRFAAGATGQWFCHSNIDGESVGIAAGRLLRRRETRRVLIVLSDGVPSAGRVADLHAHLHATVKAVTKAGIELLGIGIGNNFVDKFYPRSCSLNDVSELPEIVMGQLGWMLGAGRMPGLAMPIEQSRVRRRRRRDDA